MGFSGLFAPETAKNRGGLPKPARKALTGNGLRGILLAQTFELGGVTTALAAESQAGYALHRPLSSEGLRLKSYTTEIYENGVLMIKYLNHAIPYDDFSVTIDAESSNEDSMFLQFECGEFVFRVTATIIDTGISYDVIAPLDKPIILSRGRADYSVDEFFNRFTTKVFYSDGSVLYGKHMVLVIILWIKY